MTSRLGATGVSASVSECQRGGGGRVGEHGNNGTTLNTRMRDILGNERMFWVDTGMIGETWRSQEDVYPNCGREHRGSTNGGRPDGGDGPWACICYLPRSGHECSRSGGEGARGVGVQTRVQCMTFNKSQR